MKNIIKKSLLTILLIISISLIFPTWTPKIKGENSINELKQIKINNTSLEVMIRSADISNPIIIFVHGGPACSEIPYVRKYQKSLEQDFTIIHYDQRGSGKSFHYLEDYSNISTAILVNDLLELCDYVLERFNQNKIILIGHSFGTYIATKATYSSPEKFSAYIGIGHVSYPIESELDSLNFTISNAMLESNQSTVEYLNNLKPKIESGEIITPRKYVRKYGGACRLIDDNKDYLQGFLFGSEYNLSHIISYFIGISATQDLLQAETIKYPLPSLVQTLDIPFYFIMGKYDYMTSTSTAKIYFDSISTTNKKEFIVYENSAHYPQFEEEEKFYKWMVENFK